MLFTEILHFVLTVRLVRAFMRRGNIGWIPRGPCSSCLHKYRQAVGGAVGTYLFPKKEPPRMCATLVEATGAPRASLFPLAYDFETEILMKAEE